MEAGMVYKKWGQECGMENRDRNEVLKIGLGNVAKNGEGEISFKMWLEHLLSGIRILFQHLD